MFPMVCLVLSRHPEGVGRFSHQQALLRIEEHCLGERHPELGSIHALHMSIVQEPAKGTHETRGIGFPEVFDVPSGQFDVRYTIVGSSGRIAELGYTCYYARGVHMYLR
jgi:hypothetical protein